MYVHILPEHVYREGEGVLLHASLVHVPVLGLAHGPLMLACPKEGHFLSTYRKATIKVTLRICLPEEVVGGKRLVFVGIRPGVDHATDVALA